MHADTPRNRSHRTGAARAPSTRPARLLSALLSALIACVGCGPADDGAAPVAGVRRPNVILVVLDTFRADRVGRVHLGSSMTPQLDELAAESVVFERGFAHAPWTLPSIASLFTSQPPSGHGAGGRLGSFTRLDDAAVTLAETLGSAGYETHAITNVLFMGPRFGAMQGFETLDFVSPSDNRLVRIADVNTAAALAWLDDRAGRPAADERPFLLVVHYFDPHLTYEPPGRWRALYAAPDDARPGPPIFGSVSDMVAFRRGELALEPATIARLEGLYDGEVAYLDDQVGLLVDGLRARGLLNDSLLVVTADHGEEFGEHGGFEHGHSLYDELLHVPLMLRLPGETTTGRRVASVVGLVDVAPTLLDLASVEAPASFEGSSLRPLIEGASGPDRPVLSLGNMWGPSGRALRDGRYKLIVDAEGGTRLYDLEADPREQEDVAAREPARAAELAERLARATQAAAEAQAAELSDAEREQLRSLGYGH